MHTAIRAYERERDLDSVARIWREIGWIDAGEANAEALGAFFSAGHAEVAHINGDAECAVHWSSGSMQYETTPLRLCALTGVATSLIGRRQGFASTLTARDLEQGAMDGCAVAVLGMFEQGFYDRLGFATSAYENVLTFDPACLLVDHVVYRVPERLGLADSDDIHAALVGRRKNHGSIVLDAAEVVRAEMGFAENLHVLGYRNDDGRLTHFLWGSLTGENGPFRIRAIAYETTNQLLELLRLLRELSDQIRWVTLLEPAEVQLQVLLADPMRARDRSRKTDHPSRNEAIAWCQIRILDLDACVRARHWAGPPVRFNLSLSDPLAERLEGPWRGVGGEYVVTVGPDSLVSTGHEDGLPGVVCDVGAFSRLWFGVAPASSLAVTDALSGTPELLTELDDALRLPPPVMGWEI
ncbi:MAG: GNAT family N-acetyltransferase [Acidimicrobiales bacterium]